MNNCCLLETQNLDLTRSLLRDVTPTSGVPALIPQKSKSVALIPAPQQHLVAPRRKTSRASKKSSVQSFVELMLAAASLLFLAMT
jgi:hypothetical protein